DLTLFDKTFEIFFDGKLIACNFSSKKDVERFLNHLHLPIRQPRPSGGGDGGPSSPVKCTPDSW
ncbi:MAG TPA: hypothetical protein VGU64_04985, partial [Terriglobales bacterium]|nr:hypothetical protein [Terriglobales bacterium]